MSSSDEDRPQARAPQVLAADDQQHILDALELLLRSAGL